MLLSKDNHRICVTSADFLFTEGDLRIVTGDEEGIVRIYEYNPQGPSIFLSQPLDPYRSRQIIDLFSFIFLDPDSRDGRHLLLRTEFHGQRECRTSVTVAHRTKENPPIPSSRLLAGM